MVPLLTTTARSPAMPENRWSLCSLRLRDPQRCRRTDSPSTHCDCPTAMHVSSVPSRSDTSGCRNSCTG
ncbi:hypothetical protein DPMN_136560 [Dreissena polymorpha]|uniref:Uncharacterized protein n=1 Tax=Dreissena polymorpha TaxID=45954 RepID=A0A9D4JHY4_DREPO|nr:hypothetical protein DPMN_136560 [Dreissena polymorpha]